MKIHMTDSEPTYAKMINVSENVAKNLCLTLFCPQEVKNELLEDVQNFITDDFFMESDTMYLACENALT